MLEIARIREESSEIAVALKKRNSDFKQTIDDVLKIDEKRRQTQMELDSKQSEMNILSKEIGVLFKEGKADEANSAKAKTAALKETIHTLRGQLNNIEAEQQTLLYNLPNRPHDLVPEGSTEDDNVEIFSQGEAVPNPNALPHWEITEKHNLIDFEAGVKITGAGFPVYIGKGARLQRALINFFLNEADNAGYKEYIPPLVINEDSGYGTGQLPDKEGQMYHITEDDLYLIPTAEVPLTNLYRNVIVKETEFPIKLCGYTPCFRREAGSYGKDVRGLNRLHQFDKVEIVQIQHPDKSYETLDKMVEHVKGILTKLGLPFRIVRLCGGDLGFAAAMTYDFEVYSSAQQKWLEVSSVSNFESFQSNRMKLRYKDANGKNQFAHTLNGSALALPRIVAALLENNQTEKGIEIPECLRTYTGFDYIS